MDELFIPARPVQAHLCEGNGVRPISLKNTNEQDYKNLSWEQIREFRSLNCVQPVAFALDISSSALGSAICTCGPWTVAVSILGFISLVENSVKASARGVASSWLSGDYASSPARQDCVGFEVGVRYMESATDPGVGVDEILEKARRVVNEANDDSVADDQRRQKLPEMILETLRSVIDRSAYGSSVLCVTALVIHGSPHEAGVGVCALNALSLALGRARVQTKGHFGAAIGYVVEVSEREAPIVCLDLSEREKLWLAAKMKSGGSMTSCVLCALRGGSILYMEVHGPQFREPLSQKVLRLVCNASEAISEEIRTCIETNARGSLNF